METTNQPQEELVREVPKNNNNIFSFEGRIRRRAYWIQYFICSMIMGILSATTENGFDEGGLILYFSIFIPVYWVLLAASAKRCHDLGHSGWWMLIPFYALWLAFQNGEPGDNEYGPNPKGE